MNDLLTFGLLSFTSFFTLINPLGTMPIFMTMTADLDQEHRTKTAQKASIVSFITIVIFAFSGQLLFNFFGISVNSFRIVGGVIFFLMGMDMLQARLGKVKIRESEIKTYVNDISITPLAIPMICGPGALTNAIVMMEDADSIGRKLVLISTILFGHRTDVFHPLQLLPDHQSLGGNRQQRDDAVNGTNCYGDSC